MGQADQGRGREAGLEPVALTAAVSATPIADGRRATRLPSVALWQDALFRSTTQAFAALVLVLLVSILVALGIAAWPALSKFGVEFFFTNVWNPVTSQFGALALIYGTLVTSAIALAIGVPASFGIALFLTEMCPPILKRPLGAAVELLAAIPSIIYASSCRSWSFRSSPR
jgi:phosphate transport system permease protein